MSNSINSIKGTETNFVAQSISNEDMTKVANAEEQSYKLASEIKDASNNQKIQADYLKNRMLDEDIIGYDGIVDLCNNEGISPQVETYEILNRFKRDKSSFKDLNNNSVTAISKLIDFIIVKGANLETLKKVVNSVPDTEQGAIICSIIATDGMLITGKPISN